MVRTTLHVDLFFKYSPSLIVLITWVRTFTLLLRSIAITDAYGDDDALSIPKILTYVAQGYKYLRLEKYNDEARTRILPPSTILQALLSRFVSHCPQDYVEA